MGFQSWQSNQSTSHYLCSVHKYMHAVNSVCFCTTMQCPVCTRYNSYPHTHARSHTYIAPPPAFEHTRTHTEVRERTVLQYRKLPRISSSLQAAMERGNLASSVPRPTITTLPPATQARMPVCTHQHARSAEHSMQGTAGLTWSVCQAARRN